MAKILGVKIDEYSFNQVIQKINQFLRSGQFHQIATVNPEFIVAARRDETFRRILNQCDLNIPDGIGLKLAAALKGIKIGERLTGVDLTWELAKLAAEKAYSMFLLGAKPGVAETAAKRLRLIYPKLKIAGTYAGSPEEKGIVERVNKSKTDILLVAFGAPKQEKFIYGNRGKLRCQLAMGIGGTLDYIADIVPRAPKWMRSIGLEWLYRLFKQPSRAGRIYTAVLKFPLMVLFGDRSLLL